MTQDIVTVSWSRLRAALECKAKAHLQSTGHRSPAADIRIFAAGSIADRAMRIWLAEPDGPMRDVIALAADGHEEEVLESGQGVIRWRSSSDRATVIDWCKRLADNLEPLLREMVLPYEFEVAKRFKTQIMLPNLDGQLVPVRLIGELDIAVYASETDHRIWDLKGTEDNSYWRKTMGQMVFYDIAWKALNGFSPSKSGLIQPMCRETVKPIEITDVERNDLVKDIMKYVRAVWVGDYTPKKDNKGCDYCSVKHACPKYAAKPGSRKVSLLGGSL